MKKFVALLLLSLVVIAAVSGCGGREQEASEPSEPESASEESEPEEEPDPNFPVTVADVTIEEKPERVVSLNPSVTEIIYDMGIQDALCGTGDYCAYPTEAQSLTLCGSEIAPDLDALWGVDPQVVVAASALPDEVIETLDTRGVPLVRLNKPDSFEDLPEFYREIARVFLGEEEGPAAADAFSAPLMERFEQMKMDSDGLDEEERPVGAFAALLPLTLATGDSMQGQVLEICGVQNVADEYEDWSYPKELLIPLDPDLLVYDTRTVTLDEIKNHENYSTTKCVQEDRLLGIDGAALENCGQRMFDEMERIADFAAGRDVSGDGGEEASEEESLEETDGADEEDWEE